MAILTNHSPEEVTPCTTQSELETEKMLKLVKQADEGKELPTQDLLHKEPKKPEPHPLDEFESVLVLIG